MGIYKLGNRRITIYVDGKPAAGKTIKSIVNSVTQLYVPDEETTK
jgi:hypothetical protein